MDELYKPGTDFNPRVSYKPETDILYFCDKSDCQDPSNFYGEVSDLVCADVADRTDSTLRVEFTLDFISSGSLTAIEHFLTTLSNAVGEAKWKNLLPVNFAPFDEPTIEDAVLSLNELSEDWTHLEFTTNASDGET